MELIEGQALKRMFGVRKTELAVPGGPLGGYGVTKSA